PPPLTTTRKYSAGLSTASESFTDLRESLHPESSCHQFLSWLLRFREMSKLTGYLVGLDKVVDAGSRVHTTFQQTAAATGRLASTEPNLQNIPVRTAEGQRIRDAFVAGEGFETLLTADYSQIEMRIMAHLSEDAGLIEAFNSGEDLHNFVASRVFGVSPDAVDPAMRSKTKAVSYGLAYGLSAFGLSRQLRISRAEATALRDGYFERFGGVRDYLHHTVETARTTGYTETILGRRRYLPDLTSDNRQRRENAERVALNSPIQGSAADIIKLAMLRVESRMRAAELSSRMLLQVHDELVVEVAAGELDQVREIVEEGMGSAYQLSVPLDVGVGIGRTWREAAHWARGARCPGPGGRRRCEAMRRCAAGPTARDGSGPAGGSAGRMSHRWRARPAVMPSRISGRAVRLSKVCARAVAAVVATSCAARAPTGPPRRVGTSIDPTHFLSRRSPYLHDRHHDPPDRHQRHRRRRRSHGRHRCHHQVLQRWRHRRGHRGEGRSRRGPPGHRLQDRGRHPLARAVHQARRRPR